VKILYHHRTLAEGAEGIHIREMVHALREVGNEVRVESLVKEQECPLASKHRPWRLVSRLLPSGIYELAEVAYNVVGTRLLLRAIDQFKPDFVYDRYNTYNTAALNAARKSRLPIILEVNGFIEQENRRNEGKQQEARY